MRVVLVGAELEENLALRYIASALEQSGHQAELVSYSEASQAPSVISTVSRLEPQLVGMSVAFQRRAHEFGALATALRQHGFSGHITCGGHFPTFAYREYLQRYRAIDSVVRHEGEVTLPELCAALTKQRPASELLGIPGLAVRLADGSVQASAPRPLIEDLDQIPFPKRTGSPQMHLGIPAAFVVGSRGCYGSCTFCCIHAFVKEAGGPKYRARSADNLADELALLRQQRGARMIVFHDDDFFTRNAGRDLARVQALRMALQRRDVRDLGLVVKARPDDLDARVFAELMRIGLLRVYMGVEAGCTQGLRTLGRGVSVDQNERGLAFLRQLDVYTCFNMLLFDPDSTLQGLRESVDFLRRHTDVPMNFCRTEVYVGTPLMRRLQREQRLIGDVFGWDYHISEPAAERAFRIFSRTFRDRNFRCDGLMNSNLGLGYHLHLLRHFYPRALTSSLRERTEATVRAVNSDCVAWLDRILSFAEHASEPAPVRDFTERTAEAIRAADVQLSDRVAEDTAALQRAAKGEQVRRASLWKSVAAATLALSPLGCDPVPGPLPPDPPPPPAEPSVHDPYEPVPTRRYAQPPPEELPDAGTVVIPRDPPPPMDPPPPPHDPLPPPPDPLPPPHE